MRPFQKDIRHDLGTPCSPRRSYTIVYIVVKSFTLVELLVVVAIIAVLLAILLPALGAARAQAWQVICGTRFHSLGQSMASYALEYNDWIPGSPNTSGNGANPGGSSIVLYPGSYVWDEDRDAFPAVHIFDWASPLLELMVPSVPEDVSRRYDQSKRWAFKCPANDWMAEVNYPTRIQITTVVSSYATGRYFTYVPTHKRTGSDPGTLFWAHKFVPRDYMPRLSRLGDPSQKAFLADACKVDRSDPREISNAEFGYTTRGAWLDVSDPYDTNKPSLSYRFEPARSEAFRHSNGINLLFFDGHVEYHAEGSSDANHGFGSGARQAGFWFPSGTDTGDLPSGARFSNPDIIVP